MIKKINMIQKLVLTCFILFTVISCNENSKEPNEVQTKYGVLKGTMEDSLRVFKGIPFAQPPIGDLRWSAPEPPKSWEGVKFATEYAPAPIQGNDPTGKSEDCLYLN